MYTGLARWALATELHAEHSVLWTTGTLAAHKATLLPADLVQASRRLRVARLPPRVFLGSAGSAASHSPGTLPREFELGHPPEALGGGVVHDRTHDNCARHHRSPQLDERRSGSCRGARRVRAPAPATDRHRVPHPRTPVRGRGHRPGRLDALAVVRPSPGSEPDCVSRDDDHPARDQRLELGSCAPRGVHRRLASRSRRRPRPPAIEAERASLQVAIVLVLQRLAPPERAAYILRHAFNYPYPRIASLLRTQRSQRPSTRESRRQAHRGRARSCAVQHRATASRCTRSGWPHSTVI